MAINWITAVLLLAMTVSARAGPNELVGEPVQPPGYQATIAYPPSAARRSPGVLVLGGAEGGDKWAKAVARELAEHGYAALAQAYFKAPGLDDQLMEIPLERLRQGVERLVHDPRVDPRRIAVLGLSKGAEAALVLAASDPRIRAVVICSPSDVVWQGVDRKTGAVKSSWTRSGRASAFVPFVACEGCSLGALYTRSHEAGGEIVAEAAIAVERVAGPVLMLASTSDAVWPSAAMAQALEARLKQHRFRYPVVLLSYPEGGHFTPGPLAAEDAQADAAFGGGTAEGVLAARRNSWPRVISFLYTAFHRTPGAP